MTNDPAISLVCSTIGRPADLMRLLDSLDRCTGRERFELILVDQSENQACARLLAERPPAGPYTTTTSERGLSLGRNAGLKYANAPVVAFPDDNCQYLPDTVTRALAVLDARPHLAGVSGMQVTESGTPSMLRWAARPTTVTRRNFLHTTISSTLFLRRRALERVGPFDEGIGAGAPGPVGAGEDSDIVLRLLAAGEQLDYLPDIRVRQDDERGAPNEAFVGKMYRYGVGQGHLWRKHELPAWHLLHLSARKFAGSGVRLLRGRPTAARADLAFLRGTLAGWRPGARP
jgi:GT2 family glycosyltransferase